jgi:tetratricopeptide (TPR) repeat protein
MAMARSYPVSKQLSTVLFITCDGPRCYQYLAAANMRMNKLSEASSHLQQAMELGEKVHGRVSRQLLPILQLLVELKRRQRKYQEAEGHCQQALGIAGAEYGPQHVEVTAWKNMLAQVKGLS